MLTLERNKANIKYQGQPRPAANLLFPTCDRAIVASKITPANMGRIYYQSTYWNGCAADNVCLAEGAIVQVVERRGNTWLVKPVLEVE